MRRTLHPLFRILVTAAALSLVGCPPPPDPNAPGAMASKNGVKPGPDEALPDAEPLPPNAIDVEQWAVVQGNLKCVDALFAQDTDSRRAARASVLAWYGVSEANLEATRPLAKADALKDEVISKRVAQSQDDACPGGVASEALHKRMETPVVVPKPLPLPDAPPADAAPAEGAAPVPPPAEATPDAAPAQEAPAAE